MTQSNGRLEKALLGTKDTSQLTALMYRVMPLLKIKCWRAQEEEVWNLTMTALLAMIFINLKCLRRAMCRHICHQHESECHQISNFSLGKHRFHTAKKQECSKSGWEISLQKIGREPQKFLITLAEGFCCKWVSSDMKECWHVRSWHHWNNTKTRKLNPRDEMHCQIHFTEMKNQKQNKKLKPAYPKPCGKRGDTRSNPAMCQRRALPNRTRNQKNQAQKARDTQPQHPPRPTNKTDTKEPQGRKTRAKPKGRTTTNSPTTDPGDIPGKQSPR